MEKQVALFIMTHGNFGKAALESAELIVGKQTNCAEQSVFLVDNVDELKKQVLEKIKTLDTDKGLLILTDIVGGTPTNLASTLLTDDNVLLASGLNLPVLLEVLMNRDKDLQSLKAIILKTYSNGMTIRTYQDLQEDDEDEYSL
ncbi:PTS sugar transporter subunit IIA [Lactobacillus sp. ESL0677]|uniref:PTS sugar transporter subunit IIA n=1 Tax=Lactobacillus sp. ESL0677 TaxID=2983208 RepID=UPI0023F856BB|nr:PTS sugar transporter subunit IIA [Lactobacillus sp. ESL0677]WEV37649.1 PTS sugar transporter subunit IIA [Lactobacillus sp. ESL0677]